MLARKIQQLVQKVVVKELGAICLCLEEWFVHRVHQDSAKCEHTKQSRIVRDAYKTTVGEPSALSKGVSPTKAWARLTVTLLRNRQKQRCKSCLLKSRLWTKALMMKRLKFSDPMSSQSDVDRPSLRLNTMLRLDMTSIELGVMRA